MSGTAAEAGLLAQPDAWAAILGRHAAGGLQAPFDPGAFEAVVTVGSGSSFYLAMGIADWLRRRGRDARAVPSCEVLLDPLEAAPGPGRLAIAVSRSGRSTEGVMAVERLRAAGVVTMALTCAEGSDLEAAADAAMVVPEGREDGLVMVRSATAMLLAVQLCFGSEEDRALLAGLPQAGRAMLARRAEIAALAARGFERFVCLGSGPSRWLAREAALKVQEMAMATSEAYPTLEYRHGPMACAGPGTAVLLHPPPAMGEALARDLRALGATVIAAGPGAEGIGDAELRLDPGLPEAHAAAATLVVGQTLALETALGRGLDPDAPANLSRVVTL